MSTKQSLPVPPLRQLPEHPHMQLRAAMAQQHTTASGPRQHACCAGKWSGLGRHAHVSGRPVSISAWHPAATSAAQQPKQGTRAFAACIQLVVGWLQKGSAAPEGEAPLTLQHLLMQAVLCAPRSHCRCRRLASCSSSSGPVTSSHARPAAAGGGCAEGPFYSRGRCTVRSPEAGAQGDHWALTAQWTAATQLEQQVLETQAATSTVERQQSRLPALS